MRIVKSGAKESVHYGFATEWNCIPEHDTIEIKEGWRPEKNCNSYLGAVGFEDRAIGFNEGFDACLKALGKL